MTQEVNLYHPIFRREQKKFSARTMVFAAAALLAVGLSVYGFDLWQMHNLRQELVAARHREHNAVTELTTAAPVLGAGALRAKIAATRARIAALEQLRSVLTESQSAARGDAPVLLAVSRSVIPGLWIQSLRFDRARRLLVIGGKSERPSLVPLFLRRVATQALWPKLSFGNLTITRVRDKTRYAPYVQFTAGTTPRKGGA